MGQDDVRFEVRHLLGELTPRGKIQQYEKKRLELPWQKVRESVEVKLLAEEGELYVLAKSEGRRAKERAIGRRKLVGLLKALRKLRRSAPTRDQLLLRIGAAKKPAGRAFDFLTLRLPQEGEEVNRQTFRFRLAKEKLQKAELRDGHYLRRTNLVSANASVLWECYIRSPSRGKVDKRSNARRRESRKDFEHTPGNPSPRILLVIDHLIKR
jgi:hypothetical protein